MPKSKHHPKKPGNRADRKRREREQNLNFRIGSEAPARGKPVGGIKKFGTKS